MNELSQNVRNNAGRQRYELDTAGVTAIAVYEERDKVVAITHTEVPDAASGQGVGSALIKGALADIRARNLKLLPLCPFVAEYLERHPDDRDLVEETAGR